MQNLIKSDSGIKPVTKNINVYIHDWIKPQVKDTVSEVKYRILAEDITNIFYKDTKEGNADKTRGSLEYWKHVGAIEDIIEHFIFNNEYNLNEHM